MQDYYVLTVIKDSFCKRWGWDEIHYKLEKYIKEGNHYICYLDINKDYWKFINKKELKKFLKNEGIKIKYIRRKNVDLNMKKGCEF